jgi:DNA replication protein DnaC
MNKNQTIEKLNSMRINAMASMHQNNLKNNLYSNLTADEYLDLLTDHEWEEREQKKLNRLLQHADFRQQAAINDVDFTSPRNLEKNMFNRLTTLDFIKKSENIIVTGASGVGKSYLTQALGQQACLVGFKTKYWLTSRLFNHLKMAKVDGTYSRELNKIVKMDLLILDDFGLQAFDNHAREALLDIIEDRFNKNSTIVASQIPVSKWKEIIGESTIADAILDRLVNSSHRIDLKGESLRKQKLNAINQNNN